MALTLSGDGIVSANIVDGTIVNNDINASANIPASKLSGTGKVLQVVQGVLTGAEAIAGSGAWADFGSLTATITPSSVSSKIEVTVTLNLGTTSNAYAHAKLRRGSTDIAIGDSVGSRNRASFSVAGDSHEFTKADTRSFTYLDIPSTTSATTYKMAFKINSGQTIKINTAGEDEDSGTTGARYVSTITLREISV